MVNDVSLFLGDCVYYLQQLRSGGYRVDLVITSPPYNTGKEYEKVVSLEEYVENQRKVIGLCVDLLSDSGSICWQVGNFILGKGKEKEVYPLDCVLYPVFKSFGLRLLNRIVWSFGHGYHEKYRLSGRHETLLWFVKDSFKFNLDSVRVPQKYPNKKHFKGPNKGKLSCNPLGKNPGDVWDIPNVKHNHVEKTDHPCQFPVALVERMILATTDEGDIVLDPYIGSGSTAVACVLNNRKCVGVDINEFYLGITRQRINEAKQGTIVVRDASSLME